jgi:hypothetical protein
VLGLVAAFIVLRVLYHQGLTRTAEVATVIAAIPVFEPMVPRLRRWWDGQSAVSQESPSEAIGHLAREFRKASRDRNNQRHVNDPGAMQVRFKVTQFTQSLMTTVSLGSAPASEKGISLEELSGGFVTIIDVFTRARRLIITGHAGSGKSVLADKLACDLCEQLEGALHGRPGSPAESLLPVVLNASTLKPADSLEQWVADELVRQDHKLSLRPKGALDKTTTLARAIAADRVVPIIDGVDELPAKLRGEVIKRINEAGSDRPLVVTSRPAEYAGAVTEAGREIARAAVVDMLPLGLPQVTRYLKESAAPQAVPRWQHAFDQLDAEPDGPLATALTNPLMLWLCQRIYRRDGADPGELVTMARLVGRRAIENHLLDAFLPAAYEDSPGQWTEAQARKWLTFLASYMERTRSTELAWWRLRKAVAWWRGLEALLRGALLVVLAWWLLAGMQRWAGAWPHRPLLGGPLGPVIRPEVSSAGRQQVYVVFHPLLHSLSADAGSFLGSDWFWFLAAMTVLICGWRTVQADFGDVIGPVSIKLTRSKTRLALYLVTLLAAVVGAIMLIRAVAAAQHVPAATHLTVRGVSVLAAILISSFFAPRAIQVTPADAYRSGNPVRVLQYDRRAARISVTLAYAMPAVAAWLCFGMVIGAPACAFYGARALSALACGRKWAWGSFADASAWLAVTGRMPLRTRAFLEDANKRGVLGHAGSVYQFRHISLQRRLAHGHAAPSSPLPGKLFRSLACLVGNTVPPGPWTARFYWARAFAEQAAVLADVIGRCEVTGPAYRDPPGVVQRYGTADGRDWMMCGLPGKLPVLVQDSIWGLLHDMRAGSDGVDAHKTLGFPGVPEDAAAEGRIVTADATRIVLSGGALGSAALERDGTDGPWRWSRQVRFTFTERSSDLLISCPRVRVTVRLLTDGAVAKIKRRHRRRLEDEVSSSEFSRIMSALGPGKPVLARMLDLRMLSQLLDARTQPFRYRHGWHVAASGHVPAVDAVIGVWSPGNWITVWLDIMAGKHAAGGQLTPALGLPLEQLLDIIQAGWQAAADVIPGTIITDPLDAPVGQLTLTLLGPRMSGGVRVPGITIREGRISMPIAGITEGERARYTRQALAGMAPGFGYTVPDDWDQG